MQDRILKEIDQSQFQRSANKFSQSSQYQISAPSQQQSQIRRIPKCRIERYFTSNIFDKENTQLDQLQFQRQNEIQQEQKSQLNQMQQIICHSQPNQQSQVTLQQQTANQQNKVEHQLSMLKNREAFNLDKSQYDSNDSLNYIQRPFIAPKMNIHSNQKLGLNSKIEQPYQIQSADVKSCKFSNRPNNLEWSQYGRQQRYYDNATDQDENKKIVKNLNFTDTFNTGQIIQDSNHNLQSIQKIPNPLLNSSFQSNSSQDKSKAVILDKQSEVVFDQQLKQLSQQLKYYQTPIQQNQIHQEINKKRSQSLQTQGMSTQNSLQQLNIPLNLQMQFQQQNNFYQQQKQINQQQDNIHSSQVNLQKIPTCISQNNMHQSNKINQNNLNTQFQQINSSELINQYISNTNSKQFSQVSNKPACIFSQNQISLNNPTTNLVASNIVVSQKCQEDNYFSKKEKDQINSINNLDQSSLYKSVVSQINEDFISKDSMNLLLHEEDFLKTYRMKIEQEKNSMKQSFDFIMKYIYEQIYEEMKKQFSQLDKQVRDFIDLFQKFKNFAIEYKNISNQIPSLSSHLKNLWNSNILSNVVNYIQEGGISKLSNTFEIVDWEECIQSKTKKQQQQHAYQHIYFQQKELLFQTEHISQQIYSTLQNNRQNFIKDESLQLFLSIVDQMKPKQQQTKTYQTNQLNQTHHLLDCQKQSNQLKSKNNSLERHAGVITTEFSPEKIEFQQHQNNTNNMDTQQIQEQPSQIKTSLSNLMMQSEINTKITKFDAERFDYNNIFTQIQSQKHLTNDSSKISIIQKQNQNNNNNHTNDKISNNSLPLDQLVEFQREQLLNQSLLRQSFQQKYFDKEKQEFNKNVADEKTIEIIAEDFVERIDTYKAPYMFRDDDQIESTQRDKTITDRSQQQQNDQKNNKKRSIKKNSRSGKLSNISNKDGAQHTNQLLTDREQDIQFDDQNEQFNNTYSIQLSASRVSNQDVDQLNETINNLRLLNDSFSNQNLNETLMNLQIMNSQNNSINSSNNRISLKQLLAQTNQQLTQLSLNQQNQQQVKSNSNPPPPPIKNNFIKNGKHSDELEFENSLKNNEDIFSQSDLQQLREQLKRQDSNEEIKFQAQETGQVNSTVDHKEIFHRKLKSSKINISQNQSNKNINVNEIPETDREYTQHSTTLISNKRNPKYLSYLNLPLSAQPPSKINQQQSEQVQSKENHCHIFYSLNSEQNVNGKPEKQLNNRNISEQRFNSRINSDQEPNTKIMSEYELNTRRVSEQKPIIKVTKYEQNDRIDNQQESNDHNSSLKNIKLRSNSHLELPASSSIQNSRKAHHEFNSVENSKKGLFMNSEFDSSRSNQTIKETQISSRFIPSEVQSHMSILTSKRRFESSLTRQNYQPTNEPSFYIEFEGYVKQKQCLNDSFSRSSQRLNSQQSCFDKQNIVLSPSNRNSISQKIGENSNQNFITDLEPTCSDQYQYIKRDMRSIDIYKPKTYKLYLEYNDQNSGKQNIQNSNKQNDESLKCESVQSQKKIMNDLNDQNDNEFTEMKESDSQLNEEKKLKKKQVISCLWVRENVFAFGVSDNTLIIYNISKASSEILKEKSECFKIFQTKTIIHKMVRVSDTIIAHSSRYSKNIKLFDVDKLEVTHKLIGHNENITDITILQPNILISCSTDGCMILWQDFIITHKKQNKNQIKLLQATNDQSRLICVDTSNQILVYSLLFNDSRMRVCEIRIEKIIKTSSSISSINSSFSNNNMLACGTDEGIIRLYDICTENVVKIIKASLTSIKNLLVVEHPTSNHSNVNFILIAASESDDDLITFSKLSNSNDIISTNSKYNSTQTIASNNLSAFFILNPKYNQLQLFTLDQQTSEFSLWSLKCS